MRWVEVAPLTFRRVDDNGVLVFHEAVGTVVRLSATPGVFASDRVAFFDTTAVFVGALAVGALVSIGAVIAAWLTEVPHFLR